MAAPAIPGVFSLLAAIAIRMGMHTMPNSMPNPCVMLLTCSCFIRTCGSVPCICIFWVDGVRWIVAAKLGLLGCADFVCLLQTLITVDAGVESPTAVVAIGITILL